jgi:hypothetical protein
MVIHFAVPSVKTVGLMRVEKEPIMHLIQAGNWPCCSAAAVVDVEGLAYTVKTVADVAVLAVVVVTGASAHKMTGYVESAA